MPSCSGIRGRQPIAVSFETSRSFRGAPSGFEVSKRNPPSNLTTVAMIPARLANAHIPAPTNVDLGFAGIPLHKESERVGTVSDMKKLAAWSACTPDLHLPLLPDLGPMDLSQLLPQIGGCKAGARPPRLQTSRWARGFLLLRRLSECRERLSGPGEVVEAFDLRRRLGFGGLRNPRLRGR